MVRVRCCGEVLTTFTSRLALFDARACELRALCVQHIRPHDRVSRQPWFSDWRANPPQHRKFRAFKSRMTTMAWSGIHEKFETLDCDMFTVETEVKKSRFVAFAWPVNSGEEAMAKIHQYKDLAASHNCFAYRVGDNVRSQDDGEPGGTAGRPILSAIEGQGLDRVCVLVVRYFGGTKLGTGGLARAYSGAARSCLEQAPKKTVVPRIETKVLAPFESLGLIYQVADTFSASITESDFENCEDNKALLTINVEEDKAKALREALLEGSSGRISIL